MAQALELAAAYLAPRPRSRWEVAQRLRRAGAGDEVIEAACDRLRELGYLDDEAFARWWVEQRDRHAPRGSRLLEAELRRHGVAGEVIAGLREDASTAAPDAERRPPNDEERAAAALRAHLRGRPLPSEPGALRRLGMFLVRRGFSPDTVRAALRAAEAGDDSEPAAAGDAASGGDADDARALP